MLAKFMEGRFKNDDLEQGQFPGFLSPQCHIKRHHYVKPHHGPPFVCGCSEDYIEGELPYD